MLRRHDPCFQPRAVLFFRLFSHIIYLDDSPIMSERRWTSPVQVCSERKSFGPHLDRALATWRPAYPLCSLVHCLLPLTSVRVKYTNMTSLNQCQHVLDARQLKRMYVFMSVANCNLDSAEEPPSCIT